jgi:glucosamine--fructose-6-phosphate aminotransferase (isomerizing)
MVTFMVNSSMREYNSSASQQHPTAIPSLDCTLTGAPASVFPTKIEFNTSPFRRNNRDENTPFLIAWLIARGNPSQKSLNTVNTMGYKFLIAPKSSIFEGPKLHGKKRNFKSPETGFRTFQSSEGGQRAAGGFQLSAEQPIVVETFGLEPMFESFAADRIEFDQHFAVVQASQHAARGHIGGAMETGGQFFRALPREAGNGMKRNVARHPLSSSTRMASSKRSSSNTLREEKNQMAETRSAHPYHMYDAIAAQPALVERVLQSQRDVIQRAADAAAAKKRIIFAGIGTSLHAAQVAEHFLRHLTGGRAEARAEQPFELLNYPLALSSDDAVVVITHSGTTSYNIEVLRAARAAGALTIAVVGEASGEGTNAAEIRIQTCEQEVCFAYTKSYTTALAALAQFAAGVAQRRGARMDAAAHQLKQLPGQMKLALETERKIREVAKAANGRDRLMLFGAGPNWATACEGALKIKETSYLAAEGSENEQVLHGPFSEIDSRTVLVALLAGGPADERARTVLRSAGEVRALRIAITVPAANHDLAAEHVVEAPAVEEWLSPLVLVEPVQLLTYFLALERGINPDTGRQDQAPHAKAHTLYKL